MVECDTSPPIPPDILSLSPNPNLMFPLTFTLVSCIFPRFVFFENRYVSMPGFFRFAGTGDSDDGYRHQDFRQFYKRTPVLIIACSSNFSAFTGFLIFLIRDHEDGNKLFKIIINYYIPFIIVSNFGCGLLPCFLLSPCEKDGSFYFGSVFWIVFIAIIYCIIFRETATAKKNGRERMADCAIDLAELGLSLCCRRHPCKGCRFPVNGHACRALLLYAEPPSGRIRWRPCV